MQTSVHANAVFQDFHEMLTLMTSECMIFNEFSSLTRISLPCGAMWGAFRVHAKGRGGRGAGMKFTSAFHSIRYEHILFVVGESEFLFVFELSLIHI